MFGLAAGASHICTMVADGALFTDDRHVYCWGANEHGQLGDGSTTDRATPTQLTLGGGSIRWVVASSESTCAADDGLNLWCWGDNSVGQVGNGATSPAPVTTPQLILTTSTPGSMSPIGTAGNAMCVTVASSPVTCWGSNSGQLGLVAPTESASPSVLTDDGGYEMAGPFVIGRSSSCEILPDDDSGKSYIYCWGDDTYGQLAG
jgi:hypothetical protein